MKLIQEKAQVILPDEVETHTWQSDGAARVRKVPLTQRVSPEGISGRRLNQLPPGSDIADQQLSQAGAPARRTMSGETDPSRDWNAGAVAKGYTRLKNPDDNDAVLEPYLEVTVDGDTGLAERANLLDRI